MKSDTDNKRAPTENTSKVPYYSPKIREFGQVGILTGGGVSGAPEMGMSMSQMMTNLP